MILKFTLAALMVNLPHFSVESKDPDDMTAKAIAFIAAMKPEHRRAAVLQANDPLLYDWHYFPRQRSGLSWNDMSDAEKLAAHDLLRSSLSSFGYQKIEQIRKLEESLRTLEGGNLNRDPGRYYFLFFGEPGSRNSWSWRYEGHHLSIFFSLRGGQVTSSTPQFLGASPAEVTSGPNKGLRPIAKERDLAFDFVESLSASQRKTVRIADNAPADIVTAVARKASLEGKKGLSCSELTALQKHILFDLVRAHADVHTAEIRAKRLKNMERASTQTLVFAWMGPFDKKSRHYYRIQSDQFIIEYDNTQSDGNHIHTVWRDLTTDFGHDALAEHYEHSHR